MRIERLRLEGGELAQYGPAKHPDKQGLDEYADTTGASVSQKGPYYKAR